jgi:hypothetical protein
LKKYHANNLKIFKNIFEFLLQFLDLNNLLSSKKIFDTFKVTCQKIFLNNLTMHNDIKKIYNADELPEDGNNDFINITLNGNLNEMEELIASYKSNVSNGQNNYSAYYNKLNIFFVGHNTDLIILKKKMGLIGC